jgi:hypothetical protein
MRWAGHVARIGEKENSYGILVGIVGHSVLSYKFRMLDDNEFGVTGRTMEYSENTCTSVCLSATNTTSCDP